MKTWLMAQDQVFANCSDRPANSAARILVAAKPDVNPLIQNDRAYQIAAAYFYSEDFPKAEMQFAQSETTRILHGRKLRRSSSRALTFARLMGPQESGFNYAPMAKTEAQLQSILADNNLVEIHRLAQRRLGFVEFRLYPRERLLELSVNLSRKDGSSDFQLDLIDYTMLSTTLAISRPTLARRRAQIDAARGQNSLENLRAASDMTDWLLTMQAPGEPGANHALERWNQMHSSASSSPRLPRFCRNIQSRCNRSRSSEYFVRFAGLRDNRVPSRAVADEYEHQDAARAGLDRVLEGDRANFLPSSLNLLFAQRFKLARNFDEFLKYAPRDVAGIVTFSGKLELPDDKALDSAFSVDQEPTSRPAASAL